ncbi:MAG: ATP phosphoribosyltransferase regulatory subunit [Candidatus Tectomicrobia bacterium]|uniref:ATP phosphoribosyltransferase regulatory subunit n=1 Tax=Tectimicrobiota bacterium TaxID=2528274 RepID=A0A933LPE1_UNCTE|nr:ATP phosphoribosyltransferase regulatory subunit [Candidatus Tectomicrobia bacterium]
MDLLEYSYEVNFRFAENFEYYTGVMFEIFFNGQRVCSGGRYDELIQLFNSNRSAPAMGFAFDFNALIQLVGPSSDKKQPKILVAISPDISDQKLSFQLVDFLRAEGLKAEIDLGYQHKEVFNWIIFPKESFIELKSSDEEISKTISWTEKNRLKAFLESPL